MFTTMRTTILLMALAGCGGSLGANDLTPGAPGKADGTQSRSLVFQQAGDVYNATVSCNEWWSCDVKLTINPDQLTVIQHASAFFGNNPSEQTYAISLVHVTINVDGQGVQDGGYFGAYAARDASSPGGVQVWPSSSGPNGSPEYIKLNDPNPKGVIGFQITPSSAAVSDGWLPMELPLNVTWW